MHQSAIYSGDRVSDYKLLGEQLASLWEPGLPLYSNLANASALIRQFLDRTNWVGFYLWEPAARQLVLGPFQGQVACTRIAFGKGVCGTAIKEQSTQRVADVHQFPGHITCDSASQSEIVVPLIRADGEALGVLDIDSPERSRFDAVDQDGLEALSALIVSRWPPQTRP